MLEFSHVTKHYDSRTVLDDVTFDVKAGWVTGLVGPNGSGKTTLARILLGLAAADSGSVRIDGLPYTALDRPGHTVGTLFESVGLHPNMTAYRHLRIQALAVDASEKRVADVLADVGLGAAATRKIRGFSLGMRQRLGLATALLGRPQILVLDEPANGLDPEGIRWLRNFLRSFADLGGTVLVTSHQLAELARFADDVVVMEHGRIVEAGAADELFSNPRQDYTRELIQAVPGAGIDLYSDEAADETVGQAAQE